MNLFKTQKFYLVIIAFLLFALPFFWLKPGEMDLGGDSSRLYFYDPISYLKNASLYSVVPQGMGAIEPNYYFLPFLIFLIILKFILFNSSYLLISVFSGIKLVLGFLAIYWIVKALSHRKASDFISSCSAILSGLLYIFMPTMTGNWDKALMSHNQVFLNPLMFYLLLRFFITNNYKYLWVLLMASFIFAPNFALTSAPPFFAFYPLAVLFLILYVAVILKKKLSWKGIIVGSFLFLSLQSFHLIPQIISLFDPGSFSNVRVFDKESFAHEGIRYFIGVLPLAKASVNILLSTIVKDFGWLSAVAPLIIILGFLLNRGNLPAGRQGDKIILLTGLFFLTTLFLLTANITDIGVEFYKRLFYIPGFSMFRNFIGQWLFVYSFFYSLLFGFAIFNIFGKLKNRSLIIAITFLIGIVITIPAWPFINGSLVNKVHSGSKNVRIAIKMDPNYIKTLSFIKSLPDDSKILTLPFTDSYYQVIGDLEGGAYIGPSTISYLAGKKDFSGYQIMTAPFSEKFMKLSREKDYNGIKKLLGILNIGYIFHNSDTRIYDDAFPASPYTYMRTSLPSSQNKYSEYIQKIGGSVIFENGPYKVYSVDKNYYLPHFYAAKDLRLDKQELPKIVFRKINPTKYIITISKAKKPYVLVFLEAFHPDWKIFIPDSSLDDSKSTFETLGMKSLSNGSHVLAHDYANAWHIRPDDVGNRQNYTLIAEMTGQRVFYVSLFLSVTIFLVSIVWGIKLFILKQKKLI